MKIVLQRVKMGKVTVDEKVVGEISRGLLLFVGFCEADSTEQMKSLVKKIVHLRIFDDENGKMNDSLLDTKGSVLSVSQFTLYGDCSKGRRPGFSDACHPKKARLLYDGFNQLLKGWQIPVETGIFGANMNVSLVNDGPVTFVLETDKQM